MVHAHRERIYIRKDIILKLSDYGELNQSKLLKDGLGVKSVDVGNYMSNSLLAYYKLGSEDQINA